MGIEVFAARLKQLRKEMHLSKRRLAAMLEISHVAISYYERKMRIPDIVTAEKIARYFNTTCDYLVGLSDERYRKE